MSLFAFSEPEGCLLSRIASPSRSTYTKFVWSCAIIAVASCPSASQRISTYSFSVMPRFSCMSMWSLAIYCLPSSRVSGVRSLITSSWYSDFPTNAPKAIAMGSPIIPVPGIPTPMAFLRMFAESSAVMCCGLQPSVSVARAVHNATAMGSVQPTAGTTSRWMRSMICLRVCWSSMM